MEGFRGIRRRTKSTSTRSPAPMAKKPKKSTAASTAITTRTIRHDRSSVPGQGVVRNELRDQNQDDRKHGTERREPPSANEPEHYSSHNRGDERDCPEQIGGRVDADDSTHDMSGATLSQARLPRW